MIRRRPPADPAVAGLVKAASRSAFSRRHLLGGVGLGLGATALSACAPPAPPATAAALNLPTDVSDTDKVVRWANWTAYLDYDEEAKNYPTLQAFIEQTGIQATYSEDIEDNDAYYNKVRPQLIAGQDIGRDIFTFTDWMAGRVIREQLCQPLELIRMPNATNLLEPLKDVSFDPGRTHSLTWQSGFAGIGYNKEKVGRELKSLDDLWADDLKGKVVVLSEFRDTVGCILLQQGVDISKPVGKQQFETAVAEVEKRMADGNIRRIKGELLPGGPQDGQRRRRDRLERGSVRPAGRDRGRELGVRHPRNGGTLWSDNLMVPITSTHRRNAETLMNYYYQPEVAAQVAAYVNYICPVVGAQRSSHNRTPTWPESVHLPECGLHR